MPVYFPVLPFSILPKRPKSPNTISNPLILKVEQMEGEGRGIS